MSESGPGAQRELRASDIEHLVERQIRGGQYEQGARLPTVRELAQQYGVNKNTAARAYQGLERRGLIDLSRGRGAFVRGAYADDMAGWQLRAAQLIRDGRRLGLGRAALLEAVAQAVAQAYGPAMPAVVFIECNRQDLESLSGELSQITGLPLAQALLDDALAGAPALAERFDLVVTTFQHLGQMRQAMPEAAREQVVGVLATPTHDTLLDLARLHVATFGLVCDTPTSIESLTHIIRTYHPTAAVLPALIDDEVQLQAVVARADAIVVTRSCRERLTALGLPQPIVTVVFTIDQQSIDFLRRRLSELVAQVAV